MLEKNTENYCVKCRKNPENLDSKSFKQRMVD